jgi:hypothetical protein
MGVDEAKAHLSQHFSGEMISQRFSDWYRAAAGGRSGWRTAEAATWAMAKGGGRGILSTFLPYELTPNMAEKVAGAAGKSLPGFLGRAVQSLPDSVKAIGRFAGRNFFKWIGPVIWGTRMHYETQGLSPIMKVEKGIRITGEEAAYGFGAGVGMVAGPTIWAAVTAAIGSTAAAGAAGGAAAGGVAGLPGMIVGAAIGLVIGAVGAYAWNKTVDLVEMPIRAGQMTWNYLKDLGIRQKRLELGGTISEGNRTPMAATMRQRALLQMQRSGINARSMLGHEASMMHL